MGRGKNTFATPRAGARLFFFTEALVNQGRQLGYRFFLVVAGGVQVHLRAFPGSQHHDGHYALAIDLLITLDELNLAFELGCQADEFRRRAGVQSELVDDRELFTDQTG